MTGRTWSRSPTDRDAETSGAVSTTDRGLRRLARVARGSDFSFFPLFLLHCPNEIVHQPSRWKSRWSLD